MENSARLERTIVVRIEKNVTELVELVAVATGETNKDLQMT